MTCENPGVGKQLSLPFSVESFLSKCMFPSSGMRISKKEEREPETITINTNAHSHAGLDVMAVSAIH